MQRFSKLLVPAIAVSLLAAVACGTVRDNPGQENSGRTGSYEPERPGQAPGGAMAKNEQIPVTAPGVVPVTSEGDPAQLMPPPGAIEVSIAPAGHGQAGGSEAPARTLFLTPTYAWVNAYSLSTTVHGEPVQPGSVVLAYDPDGVVIGRATVTKEGRFGVMALYMDDPATPIDEGALPGDVLTFQIDGEPAVAVGTQAPIWSANGAVLSLDLVVGGPVN